MWVLELLGLLVLGAFYACLYVGAAVLVILMLLGQAVAIVARHARWRLAMRKRARGYVIDRIPEPRRALAPPRVPPARPRRRR